MASSVFAATCDYDTTLQGVPTVLMAALLIILARSGVTKVMQPGMISSSPGG
jgi:hypothetical protein